MSRVSEKNVETWLRRSVEAVGGVAWKWGAGKVGAPDRIVLMPGGRVVFVEVKTEGGRLSALQRVCHRRMAALGAEVRVVWSRDDVDALIREIRK